MALRKQAIAEARQILGVMGLVDPHVRMDAGETAIFARQLEHIRAKTYDVEYEDLRALDFIPLDGDVPAAAETLTRRSWDYAGMAQIIESYADDLPTVTLLGRELTTPIKSLGAAYDYTIQDVRAAAMANVPLDAKKASAARRMVDLKIDNLLAFGDAAHGIPGFLNHANVPVVEKAADGFLGGWVADNQTAVEVLEDLQHMANKITLQTKEVHTATHILLPTDEYLYAARKSFTEAPQMTALTVFLQARREMGMPVTVQSWSKLDTADTPGTGGRAVVFARKEDVVSAVLPLPFEQLPAQSQRLSFYVPCHARCGGTTVHRPLGMAYYEFDFAS